MESVNNGCKLDDGKINQSIIKGIDTRGPIKDEIESAKAELTGVREENTRLKALLQQIETDYKNLQAQLMDVLDQDKSIKNGPTTPVPATNGSSQNTQGDHDDEQEHELSLCLGMVSGPSESKRDGVTRSGTSNSSKSTSCERDELKLRLLDYNLEGANGNGDGIKEGGVEGEKWPPSKVLKTKGSEEQPEEVGQTSVKRARVCVRARCETQTMNDGCQWRKYGQKIAKGNPCPRAYYRCTVSPLCPVRKQVQRSVEDMSVLITTYEGTHNHPLSASATVLASTTSAAASMLLSGSSTSQPSNITINSPFGPPRPQPYYYPNASSTTLPTITLDLTTQPASTTSTGFNLYSSNFQTLPRVPTSSLSFGSTSSNAMPSLWGNGALSFGSAPGPYNSYPSLQFGKQPKEQTYQPSYLEKFNQGASQQTLTETLTKVITSDPSLRSVLAAAISSIQANGDKGDTFGQNLKLGGHVPAATDSS